MSTIAVDARELQGKMTGIGRFLTNFLDHAAQSDRKNSYLLIYNRAPDLSWSSEQISHLVIPETHTFIWDQIQLPKALKENKVDVFFSPYYKCPVWMPTPSVITIHDVHFFTLPLYRKQNGFLLNTYYRLSGWIFCRRARAILTVSENSKKDILAAYGPPPEKIHVVYNAVDQNRFRPLDPDQAMTLIQKRLPQIRGPYILYVGNSKPHKNVPALIRAYALLPQAWRGLYQLVLVGVDEDLRNVAAACGLDQEIVIVPSVPDDLLPAIYNGAALYISASLYEGFCIPVVEAMACGTPVLVSNRGAFREIVEDAGLLIDPDDPSAITIKIMSLLEDVALRKELIRKGLDKAKRYSIERFSTHLLAVLEKTGSTEGRQGSP